MLEAFQKLLSHQQWADELIHARVSECEAASSNAEMIRLLHHIAIVQSFFLHVLEGRDFDAASAAVVPGSLQEVTAMSAALHRAWNEYAGRLTEGELSRMVAPPFFKDFQLPVSDVLFQVTMHSQNHRGQCATALRLLGGNPATMDYIMWLKDHRSDLTFSGDFR